ncbi:MAG: hypothetical protein ACYDHZ_07905 [Dehalococcoidia bacterium]
MADESDLSHRGIYLIHREEKIIFQRFNFFLIAMALLIGVFVLIATYFNYPVMLPLSLIIFFTGYLLSYIVALANYSNAKVNHRLAANLAVVGPDKHWDDLYDFTLEQDAEIKKLRWSFIGSFLCDSGRAFLPFDKKSRGLRPFTWLIPSGFVLAWIAVWAVVITKWFYFDGYIWFYWSGWAWWLTLCLLLVLPFIVYYVVLVLYSIGKLIGSLFSKRGRI